MTGGSGGRKETGPQSSPSSGPHTLPGTAAGDSTSCSGAAITTSSLFQQRFEWAPREVSWEARVINAGSAGPESGAAQPQCAGRAGVRCEPGAVSLTPWNPIYRTHREATRSLRHRTLASKGHAPSRIHSLLRSLFIMHLLRARPCPRCWRLQQTSQKRALSSRGSLPM